MDEASVCGMTSGVRLQNGVVSPFAFQPEDCGLQSHRPEALLPDAERHSAAVKMYQLLAGRGDAARLDAVILNSALVFFVKGMVVTISEGVEKAREILLSGQALAKLRHWVEAQNSDPSVGFDRLSLLAKAGR